MKTVTEVTKFVEDKLNLNLTSKVSKNKRTRELVYARCVVYHICRSNFAMSLAEIGKPFGKDHATVLHNLNNVLHLVLQEEIYTDVINKANKIIEFDKESEVESVKKFFQLQDAEYEIAQLNAENRQLRKELSSLEEQTKELNRYIDSMPMHKELSMYFSRMTKSKRALAEERVLNAARMIYNA